MKRSPTGKNKVFTLGELAARLDGSLEGGDPKVRITGVAGIREAGPGEITFLGHRRHLRDLMKTRAAALVASMDLDAAGLPLPIVRVANPYVAFARLLGLYFHRPLPPAGISPHAFVGKARLGRNVVIGPFAYVGDGAAIGDGAILYPGVYVGEGVEIGEGSLIYPNVILREGVRIGRRVIIHGGAVLGSDGFGFVFHEGGHEKIPQTGGVVIGDDVEIGANVTIDRGTLGDTRIGRGTKIDNLVQIGHNVAVGEHALLIAQAGISGSAELGNYAILAGQAGVAGHLRIGDQVRVGAKGGVTKDIPAGETVSGFPAVPHREWLRSQALVAQLPRLLNRLAVLEEKLEGKKARSRKKKEGK